MMLNWLKTLPNFYKFVTGYKMNFNEKALKLIKDIRENADTIERELNADVYNASKAQYHLAVIKSRSTDLEHSLEYAGYKGEA